MPTASAFDERRCRDGKRARREAAGASVTPCRRLRVSSIRARSPPAFLHPRRRDRNLPIMSAPSTSGPAAVAPESRTSTRFGEHRPRCLGVAAERRAAPDIPRRVAGRSLGFVSENHGDAATVLRWRLESGSGRCMEGWRGRVAGGGGMGGAAMRSHEVVTTQFALHCANAPA